MNKKTWIQMVLLLVLLGVGIYFGSVLSRPPTIQILCDFHERRVPRPSDANANPSAGQPQPVAAFGLNQRYELTSVKVVPLAEWKTNKDAHPLWYLTAETRSEPVKAFLYGQNLEGMDSVSGTDAEPLASKVDYLLLVEAGRRHGECEFKLP